MRKNGMTMFYRDVDYFFVTDQFKRTDKLIRNIAVTMMRANGRKNVCVTDITDETVQFIRWRLMPGVLEHKQTESGREYYNIRTENGCTSGCTLDVDLKIYKLEV